MAKLSAKEITEGMLFEIVSQDSILPFGMKKDDIRFENQVRVKTGTKIVVTKAPYNSTGQLIDFKIAAGQPGSGAEFSAFWSVFRTNTQLLAGIPKEKEKLAIISNGPYAGVDMFVENVKFQDYFNGLGFGTIEIKFKFEGEYIGAKQINTKLLNIVKASPNFRQAFIDKIFESLEIYKKDVDEFLKKFNAKEVHEYYRNGVSYTRYSGGRLLFVVDTRTNDFEEVKKDIIRAVDRFIASKTSMA